MKNTFIAIIIIIAIIAMILTREEDDKSIWKQCQYKYKIYSSYFNDINSYTNNEPDSSACIQTTTGTYCGNFVLRKTIKGTKKCEPLGRKK